MRLKAAVAVLALLLCGAAKADTVYDITGAITSNGNTGSTITVDYSYVMDVGYLAGYGDVFSTEDQQVSGSGSLGGAFTMGNYTYGGAPGSYVPIFDAEGDEIDLVSTAEDSVIPSFATWYKCQDLCIADFMPLGSSNSVYYNAGAYYGAYPFTMIQTVTDAPTNTPEAPAGLLLLLGFCAIAAGKRVFLKAANHVV